MAATRSRSTRLDKSSTRIAGLKSKGFGDDHPKVVAARADHQVVKAEVEVERRVQAIIDTWPELTDEQIDRIAGLLRTTPSKMPRAPYTPSSRKR